MRLLPLLLLPSACAAATDAPSSGERGLERELAGRTAGEPENCVAVGTGSGLVPRGRQALVHERGDTIWVNRLRSECPGLDGTSQIVIDLHGSRYCRGDRFRTRHSSESIPGPVCVLGSFTPYRR